MKKIKSMLNYFSKSELVLWACSSAAIILSAILIGKDSGFLSILSSLLGVTSLTFNAKGNPLGPALMVIFSLVYGYISLEFAYYGEMFTYVCMTMPMSLFSLITWLKNPYKGKKSEVTVNTSVSKKEYTFLAFLTAGVTAIFYFILSALNTANIFWSTVSVATSFAAVYLTSKRSPYFALGYAANDIVLIILWTLASLHDSAYLSVVICFAAFLTNDVYAFFNWKKIAKRQAVNDKQ